MILYGRWSPIQSHIFVLKERPVPGQLVRPLCFTWECYDYRGNIQWKTEHSIEWIKQEPNDLCLACIAEQEKVKPQ